MRQRADALDAAWVREHHRVADVLARAADCMGGIMRVRVVNGPLTVQATAGTNVVLLGMNVLRHFRIEQQGRQMWLTPVDSGEVRANVAK